MSAWTHSICDSCWDKIYRELRTDPVRTKHAPIEKCCFCSHLCVSGIYVRNDPTDEMMKCRGIHPDDD